MGYDYIMKIKKTGSSMKQTAYARRVFGAEGTTKKEIALNVGYSPSVANSVVSKIESRKGFNNAMARLAADSNNLVLEIMSEFKARGFSDYSNKDLTGAMNAITNAWTKFNGMEKQNDKDKQPNRLRAVILQRVENQVVNTSQESLPVKEIIEEVEEEDNPEDLGF